jgi:hypothetical protein
MEWKSMKMIFDQPDDAFNFSGERSAEARTGLLIPVAGTEQIGASGRMKADRHS